MKLKLIIAMSAVVFTLALAAIISADSPKPGSTITHQRSLTPIQNAARNAREYVEKSSMGQFEILKVSVFSNDPEIGVGGPAFIASVLVRIQGPFGPKKGVAVLWCDHTGAIIAMVDMPTYAQFIR